mmetsp:Transcript_44565/g.105624  ORF Transcript_44565/g.105624 Transcript_44565/m.105624 type:complete len:219 (-) Transcript_44565:1781-2437(-)
MSTAKQNQNHSFSFFEGAVFMFWSCFARSSRTTSLRVAPLEAFLAACDRSSFALSFFLRSLIWPFSASAFFTRAFFSCSFLVLSRMPATVISPEVTLPSSFFFLAALLFLRTAFFSSCVSSSCVLTCFMGARTSSGAFTKASDTIRGMVSSILSDGTFAKLSAEKPLIGWRGVKVAFVSMSSLCINLAKVAFASFFCSSSCSSSLVLWFSISASYCLA